MGLAVLIDQCLVEVVDLAQAIATERQRVDQRPKVQLATIEGVLAVMRWRRVTVWYDHVRHRRPMQDGPPATIVLPADGVQDEAFARREADTELPLLPAHERTVNGEARSLRLADLERLEIRSQRPHVIQAVAGVPGRDRHH